MGFLHLIHEESLQILQDYQAKDAGNATIRLLEVDSDAGAIAAKIYSNFYEKTLHDASKFTITTLKST